MVRLFCCGLLALLLGNVVSASDDGPPQPTTRSDPRQVIRQTNQFGLKLHDRLPSRDGDLCYCPVSVSQAFLMMYARARGETAAEMGATLHVGPNQDSLQAAMAAYLGG